MTADRIATELTSRGIEHSGYIRDERSISAALRERTDARMVTRTTLLTFRFDAQDKLLAIDRRDALTGP